MNGFHNNIIPELKKELKNIHTNYTEKKDQNFLFKWK